MSGARHTRSWQLAGRSGENTYRERDCPSRRFGAPIAGMSTAGVSLANAALEDAAAVAAQGRMAAKNMPLEGQLPQSGNPAVVAVAG